MIQRLTSLGWSTAAVCLLLVGCGSNVKLDETPVESRTVPSASAGATNPALASRQGGTAMPAPPSQVATVDLARSGLAADPDALANQARVVYFDFDSFVVRDDYRGMLEGHARALSANKARGLVVEGHTDERGGREYNLALGQKRAEAVAKSLVLLGAAEGQIEAVSFGKERPADPGQDEAAWAKNRRAELKDR